jgi:hypothetical protein
VTTPPERPPGQTNRAKVITVIVFVVVIIASAVACLYAVGVLGQVIDVDPRKHF